MGLEALSRGASQVTLIEHNKLALSCIKENINMLQVASQITLIPQDAKQGLAKLAKQSALFDLIYIDPPYDQPLTPIVHLLTPLLAPHAIVFLEERYNPKELEKTYTFPYLDLKDKRRFGIALLSTFLYKKD